MGQTILKKQGSNNNTHQEYAETEKLRVGIALRGDWPRKRASPRKGLSKNSNSASREGERREGLGFAKGRQGRT